jgi:hypothetical protein
MIRGRRGKERQRWKKRQRNFTFQMSNFGGAPGFAGKVVREGGGFDSKIKFQVSEKHQAPSTKEAPSSKLQKGSATPGAGLWMQGGVLEGRYEGERRAEVIHWCLVLDVWWWPQE